MNTDVKKLWLNALVSGKYDKTTQRLKDDTGYCCLGVLCEVYRSVNGGEWVSLYPEYEYEFKGSWSKLPHVVADWAGIEENPLVTYNGRVESLANLNDGSGVPALTFNEIAELINEQL